MSPLQAFEIFFLFAQVLRNSLEAIYKLADKSEDSQYKIAVGFASVIIALWFLVAIFERGNAKTHPVNLASI